MKKTECDKKSVLVVAHGSRAKETEAALEAVLSMVKEKLPNAIIEGAFMEFSERTLEKGVSALAAKGATEIKIIPYFLFMGTHLKKNIPHIRTVCAASFPGIKITMGEPLGVDERLADILVDRIADNVT
ncbi:MAG: CbiX/SirB N-terminal domain-containing protein [Peptococcaceae bacterium]|nr:CbiX/SirB N-terminal domain-containing protein [Peptococcaceae bacterium]